MVWINLNSESQLSQIIADSYSSAILLFKHSTRCSISDAAKVRLERQWNDAKAANVSTYYLDLLQYREISNSIATQLQVQHQSPQVIIIKNGKAVVDVSHIAIQFNSIANYLQ